MNWQITPRALTEAMAPAATSEALVRGDDGKIDVAAIKAARRG